MLPAVSCAFAMDKQTPTLHLLWKKLRETLLVFCSGSRRLRPVAEVRQVLAGRSRTALSGQTERQQNLSRPALPSSAGSSTELSRGASLARGRPRALTGRRREAALRGRPADNPPFAGERGARPLLRRARRGEAEEGRWRRPRLALAPPGGSAPPHLPAGGRAAVGAVPLSPRLGAARRSRQLPTPAAGTGTAAEGGGAERNGARRRVPGRRHGGGARLEVTAAAGGSSGGTEPPLQSAGGERLPLSFRAPPLPEKLCGASRGSPPCAGAPRHVPGVPRGFGSFRPSAARSASACRLWYPAQPFRRVCFFPPLLPRLLLCDAVALWCLRAAGRAANSVVAGKKPLMTSGGESSWNSQSPVRTLQPIRPLTHSNARPLGNGRKLFCAFIRYFSLDNSGFWVDSLIGSRGFAFFFIKTTSGENGVLPAFSWVWGREGEPCRSAVTPPAAGKGREWDGRGRRGRASR